MLDNKVPAFGEIREPRPIRMSYAVMILYVYIIFKKNFFNI